MVRQPRPRAKRRFGNVYEARGSWYVRYSVAGKRFHVRGGETRDDAEAVLARLTLDHAHDRIEGRTTAGPSTLREFLPRLWGVWKPTLRKATISTRKAVLNHYAGVLVRPMRDLSQVEAEAALLGRLRSGKRASTVHADLRVLASAWQVALRMEIVRRNPWRGIRLPKVETEPHRRLSDEELERLYAKAAETPGLLLPVLLMGEAGLRRNEVVQLLWGDVAGDRGTVLVRAAVAKSHKARRVPLSARATAALEEAGKLALPTARVCPFGTARLNVHFRRAADGAGLPDATPHTLRHTYGHRFAELGGSLYVLRDLLGHASVRQTEVYASRATEDTLRRAVDHAEALRASRSRARSDSRM